MTSSTHKNPPCGPVEGLAVDGVLRFTGIPYATAPRFGVPQPLQTWTTPFDASKPSHVCPQPSDPSIPLFTQDSPYSKVEFDEHCQQLSITTPLDADPDSRLNVLCWVHGGAFVNGGDIAIYDPSAFVREGRVIVVNISYRLGLFGFLGDGKSKPANLGLLDQIQALHWVRANIAAFGGNDDPKSITLFGQSAGGSSLADLMATTNATSLFGRAIIQSAPFGISRGRDRMNAVLLEKNKHISLSSSVDEILTATVQTQEAGSSWGLPGAMVFAPQYGLHPLPSEAELEMTLSRVAPEIDILIGSTVNEASLVAAVMPWVEKVGRVPIVGSLFVRGFVSISSRLMFQKGARNFAQRHAQAGGKVSHYDMSWSARGNEFGAAHGIEIPLLFGSAETWVGGSILKGAEWEEMHQMGAKLRQIWINFAKGKQPTKSDSVEHLISIT